MNVPVCGLRLPGTPAYQVWEPSFWRVSLVLLAEQPDTEFHSPAHA